ncbi:MAG: hypothetical protein HQK87_04830 [Nitrospinae bacterium]|nr:hypothetical protein [Nitrospinota bacterium]
MMRSLFRIVPFILALTLAACGGGGGGGGGEPTAPAFSPEPSAVYSPGGPPEFWVTDDPVKGEGNLYHFYLVTEENGATVSLAESDDLPIPGDGVVRWTPAGVTIKKNRAYQWRWSVTDAKGTTDSESHLFYVRDRSGGEAIAPRQNGYLDLTRASTPTLAAFNVLSVAGASVTYDFQLFADEAMTLLIGAGVGVPQLDGQVATSWTVTQAELRMAGQIAPDGSTGALREGATYWWRVRYTVNGTGGAWQGPYVFTVKNLCDISGTLWAEYPTEWTTIRECDLLVNIDPEEAMGPPSAHGFMSQEQPGSGYISIDYSGKLGIEMGKTVFDGPGDDLRVWEYVSSEWLEVYAGPSENGPWYSMGKALCPEFCDFDLGVTGLRYARWFRIVSLVNPFDPGRKCYQTAGPDIDAIKALRYTTAPEQCQ